MRHRSQHGQINELKQLIWHKTNNGEHSKVTLNSNDPSVPTVLDLDALVAMLMGGAEGL